MRTCPARFFAIGVFLFACVRLAGAANGMPMRLLDNFDDISQWQVSASDDVKATLHRSKGRDGNALCMTFDF